MSVKSHLSSALSASICRRLGHLSSVVGLVTSHLLYRRISHLPSTLLSYRLPPIYCIVISATSLLSSSMSPPICHLLGHHHVCRCLGHHPYVVVTSPPICHRLSHHPSVVVSVTTHLSSLQSSPICHHFGELPLSLSPSPPSTVSLYRLPPIYCIVVSVTSHYCIVSSIYYTIVSVTFHLLYCRIVHFPSTLSSYRSVPINCIMVLVTSSHVSSYQSPPFCRRIGHRLRDCLQIIL